MLIFSLDAHIVEYSASSKTSFVLIVFDDSRMSSFSLFIDREREIDIFSVFIDSDSIRFGKVQLHVFEDYLCGEACSALFYQQSFSTLQVCFL
jgi:hypothetical protein